MAGENDGTVNPLDSGTNPHSVETAAADFTAMLNDEAAPAPRRERAAKPVAQSPAQADDAGEREDGQPERQPRKREREEPSETDGADDADPILDNPEPKPRGEDDEEDPDNEDGDDPDDQDGDDDSDDDEDDDEAEGDVLKAKVVAKVNGEELEITVEEALAGYMKDADYRQGTERNAREYEEIEAYAAETVELRATVDSKLTEALALIEAMAPSKEDWEFLEKNDPAGFIKAQKHWEGLQEKARKIVEDRNALAEGQNKIATRRDAKYFADQERALVTKLPALRDEKKAESFRATIMEYGLANGYSEEELRKGATDHRDLITLYKAARYDAIQRSKTAAGKNPGKNAPKPSLDTRARTPAPGRGKQRSAGRQAERRLAATGHVHDAADAFAAMIRDEAR